MIMDVSTSSPLLGTSSDVLRPGPNLTALKAVNLSQLSINNATIVTNSMAPLPLNRMIVPPLVAGENTRTKSTTSSGHSVITLALLTSTMLHTTPSTPSTTATPKHPPSTLPSKLQFLQFVKKSLSNRKGGSSLTSATRLRLAGRGESAPMLAYADTIIKVVLILCAIVVVVIPLLAWARRRRKRYLRPAPRISQSAWARQKVRRFFCSPVQTTRLLFQRLDAENHWYQSIPGSTGATASEDDALLCDEEEVADEATFVGVSQPILSNVSNV